MLEDMLYHGGDTTNPQTLPPRGRIDHLYMGNTMIKADSVKNQYISLCTIMTS